MAVFLSGGMGVTLRGKGSAPCSVADTMHDLFSSVNTYTNIIPRGQTVASVQLQAVCLHRQVSTLGGMPLAVAVALNYEEQA